MKLFKKKSYVNINLPNIMPSNADDPMIPDGMWIKCKRCDKTIYKKEIGDLKICPKCNGTFRLSAFERIEIMADEDTFVEINKSLTTVNPINFPGYEKKISAQMEKTSLNEGVVTGTCKINGEEIVICVMDSRFMMGSMGSVVGEKMTRAFEYALEKSLPLIAFTASGGARMQEGIISLMQMAKVSAAVGKHSNAGLLYISVITDPTTGGVTASFAMQGDIIISEPNAVIGFAGRRVIEQTMKQKLPDEFQTAEFVLEHGFIDKIVDRKDLKDTLHKILVIHKKGVN